MVGGKKGQRKTDVIRRRSLETAGAFLAVAPRRYAYGVGPGRWQKSAPLRRLAFYAPDFFLAASSPWWVPESATVGSKRMLASLAVEVPATPPSFTAPDKQSFRRAFEAVARWRSEGSLIKAVPVVFSKSRAVPSTATIAAVVQRLVASPAPGIAPYGLWERGSGLLGATPELLCSWNGRELRTMALAGTRATPARSEPTLWSEKNRGEHRYVVDDIVGRLASLGTVRVGRTTTATFDALQHLRTPVVCRPRRAPKLENVVALLHPTAALGVYPRSFPWQRLAQLPEAPHRGRFGAPFGVRTADGRFVCVVAIRGIQWDRSGTRLGTGVGLVPDSRFEDEWQEIAWKRTATLRRLGLAEGA